MSELYHLLLHITGVCGEQHPSLLSLIGILMIMPIKSLISIIRGEKLVKRDEEKAWHVLYFMLKFLHGEAYIFNEFMSERKTHREKINE